MHPRHAHERMPPHQPLDRPLILGLELVIELLGDPLSHLGGERLGVQSGREPLDERQQQRRIAQVRIDGLGDTRILDLHGHLVAVDGCGAMHLANRRRGERTLVEVAEHAPQRPAELLSHELLEIRERARWQQPKGRDAPGPAG